MEISKRIKGEVKMKYQKHYLSDEKSPIYCPLSRGIRCDSFCAWFDHEHHDCRQLGMICKIREDLQSISKNIFDGFDALFQKS